MALLMIKHEINYLYVWIWQLVLQQLKVICVTLKTRREKEENFACFGFLLKSNSKTFCKKENDNKRPFILSILGYQQWNVNSQCPKILSTHICRYKYVLHMQIDTFFPPLLRFSRIISKLTQNQKIPINRTVLYSQSNT